MVRFIKMLGEFLLSDCFSDRYAVPIAASPTEGAEPLPYSSAQINNNFSGCCVKPIAHSVLHWAMMVPFIFLWIKFPEQKNKRPPGWEGTWGYFVGKVGKLKYAAGIAPCIWGR